MVWNLNTNGNVVVKLPNGETRTFDGTMTLGSVVRQVARDEGYASVLVLDEDDNEVSQTASDSPISEIGNISVVPKSQGA